MPLEVVKAMPSLLQTKMKKTSINSNGLTAILTTAPRAVTGLAHRAGITLAACCLLISSAYAAERPNLRPFTPNGWSSPLEIRVDESDNTVKVNWAVINDARIDVSSEFRIRIYVDGVTICGWRIPSLKSRYYVSLRDFQLPLCLADGRHTLEIRADATDTISENSEADNRFRGSDIEVGDEAPLAWGAKVSQEFRDKVRGISSELGCDPNHLMAAMAFETGRTFSPTVLNPQSGAIGLVQFTSIAITDIGTTKEALARMTAVQQLDMVKKYLSRYSGRMALIDDIYMVILWQKAVGQDSNYVLFSKPSIYYTQNAGFDVRGNNDGKVTKAEASAQVRAMLTEGMKPENMN